MKAKFLVFLIILFSFTYISAQTENKQLNNYLKQLQKAVKKHDLQTMLILMDKDYLKEQHDEFLKGNTEQFLKEFFCGNSTSDGKFSCVDFEKLKAIKVLGCSPIAEGPDYSLSILITDENGIERKNIFLILAREINGKITFGLEGARG